ncbi:MAG TPA: aminopeptidase, partial [Flavisolibacter sp.]|nr:aminopeptidase [Flavisolibacter sp.]
MAQQAVPPGFEEAGVSQSLARYRSQVLDSLQYSISFSVPSQKDIPVTAFETITFNWNNGLMDLLVDFKEDKDHLKKILLNGASIPVKFKNEHIIISPDYLRKGRNNLSFNFTAGNLSLNRNDDYLYTLLVPDRARTVFPCFDQPDLKARYQLNLTIPKNWNAVSSAPVKDSILKSETKTFQYQMSDKISTYLFSFVAGNFKKVSKNIDGRQMTFYHR